MDAPAVLSAALKLAVNLGGTECVPVQANVLLQPAADAGVSPISLPLICTRDAEGDTCRITIASTTAPTLRPTTYTGTLIVSWAVSAATPPGGRPTHQTVKWKLGRFDFTAAAVPPPASGTKDQREDVFAKIHAENRPPFGTDRRRPPLPPPLVYAAVGLVLLPWVLLVAGGRRLALLGRPLRQVARMTLRQQLFYLAHLAWMALALINWRGGLGTFAALKAGGLLLLPTLLLGLGGLREAVAPAKIKTL